VFHRPAYRTARRPSGGFHRLRRPLRVRATMPSPVLPDRVAPPGVSRPFSDINRREPFLPGLPHPARSAPGVFHPLGGLLPPRPCGHMTPAAAPGVSMTEALSGDWAGTCRHVRCTPLASGAYHPQALRNMRSDAPAPRRHLSPQALVPWPWFQDFRTPLRSPSFPDRRSSFRRRSSPLALCPSAPRRTAARRAGAPGCSTDPGTGGSARDPQLPWGSCDTRKTLWRLPVLFPDGHRHARQGRRFSAACAPSGSAPRLPGPRRPSLSPDYQRTVVLGLTGCITGLTI
jgi:hypothetical protein